MPSSCLHPPGVVNLLLCQYFLLNKPQYYWLWYSIITPTMLLSRMLVYRTLGWAYFMIDFCYFTIGKTVVRLKGRR